MASDHYTYRVTWSAEDGAYVGECLEFPSMSWLDEKNPEGALSGIRDIIGKEVRAMKRAREEPPEPLADRTYSGKFQVRIPPEEHRRLAIRAAEEGISLNRLVSAKLAG